jgi:hypothetical protein
VASAGIRLLGLLLLFVCGWGTGSGVVDRRRLSKVGVATERNRSEAGDGDRVCLLPPLDDWRGEERLLGRWWVWESMDMPRESDGGERCVMLAPAICICIRYVCVVVSYVLYVLYVSICQWPDIAAVFSA